jgi:lysophospholipase L1-like esterase
MWDRPGEQWRRLFRGVARVADQVEPYAQSWARHNEAVLHDDRPLWVALGDSLSQGIGATTWESGWLPTAARELAALGRPYRVLNLSATGATTDDVLKTQLPVLADLDPRPALVTLLVGSNDMISRKRRPGLFERWAALLPQLPERSVVALMPQPVPVARRVNALITRYARDRRLVAVNVRPAAWPILGHRAPDLFHPNDHGYRRIADLFVRAIAQRSYP